MRTNDVVYTQTCYFSPNLFSSTDILRTYTNIYNYIVYMQIYMQIYANTGLRKMRTNDVVYTRTCHPRFSLLRQQFLFTHIYFTYISIYFTYIMAFSISIVLSDDTLAFLWTWNTVRFTLFQNTVLLWIKILSDSLWFHNSNSSQF